VKTAVVYRRAGTANLFLIVEPLTGHHQVTVTKQRTKSDFAQQMKYLCKVLYPAAQTIRVVLDNLNTHSPGALYTAFAPEEARRLTKSLEFHYIPKHASWLNRRSWSSRCGNANAWTDGLPPARS
jgi:DDE superfamily endonuclease